MIFLLRFLFFFLFVSSFVNAQTVDFAFTALLMLNAGNEGFSTCENFRKHDKLKFLFHHDRTCFFKANFEESKADSVIIKVRGDKDPHFYAGTGFPIINVVEYYQNFETAKKEYLKRYLQIRQELLSNPQFYKPGKYAFFNSKLENDTSFMAKKYCDELPEYYVYKHFQFMSSSVVGTIETDLQCRRDLYLIIVSVQLN